MTRDAGGLVPIVFADLRARYSEPWRKYHTARHLRHLLGCLKRWRGSDLPDTLCFAVLWHDAVYDPTRADNEERSAELCAEFLRANGAAPETIVGTTVLILATKTHSPPENPAVFADAIDLLDADLWVLGAPRRVYDRYAALIRAEYAHVPNDAYRVGRARVLATFLRREQIYRGARAACKIRENQARENLKREWLALQVGDVNP